MHKISLPYNIRVHMPPGDVGVDLETLGDLGQRARENKIAIIECALAIENNLVRLISYYFFGPSHEKKETFIGLILHADWCSFAAKRNLVLHIVNECKLCKGSEKEEIATMLRDVMRYRNAFTHGRLISDGTTFWLSFFEVRPQ